MVEGRPLVVAAFFVGWGRSAGDDDSWVSAAAQQRQRSELGP